MQRPKGGREKCERRRGGRYVSFKDKRKVEESNMVYITRVVGSKHFSFNNVVLKYVAFESAHSKQISDHRWFLILIPLDIVALVLATILRHMYRMLRWGLWI